MTTRALQFDILLAGLTDINGSPLTAGTIEFKAAGTSDAKAIWTEKEKTNPFTSITLDSYGQKQIYGDGVYKLIVKSSAGATLHTWDDIKIQATTFTLSTKVATYTATPDDDVILCDTDGGAFTVNLDPAATFSRPLIIRNVGTSGNDVTIDPNGAETIDGNATLTASDGVAVNIVTDGSTWYSQQSHGGTHITGGADEIDGDKLDIDYTPTNYVPATTPAEADHLDNLTAHLYGLDMAMGAFKAGTIMLFGQASAPVGWTKKLDWQNTAALTISSDANGTALASGGAQALQSTHTHGIGSFAFPNHSHGNGSLANPNHSHAVNSHFHSTPAVALSIAMLASHNHAGGTTSDPGDHTHPLPMKPSTNYAGVPAPTPFGSGAYLNTDGGGSHTHTLTPASQGSGSTHAHGNTGGKTGTTTSSGTAAITGSTASDAGAAITGTSAVNAAPYYQEIMAAIKN